MATDSTKVAGLSSGKPLGAKVPYWIEHTINCVADVITAANIVQGLPVKAGQRVLKTNIKMVTPAVGTALTADIGDGDGANSFDAAIDMKGAAGVEYESAIGTDAYAAGGNGKLYTADDFIDVKWNTVTAVTAGPKFVIRALIQDLN